MSRKRKPRKTDLILRHEPRPVIAINDMMELARTYALVRLRMERLMEGWQEMSREVQKLLALGQDATAPHPSTIAEYMKEQRRFSRIKIQNPPRAKKKPPRRKGKKVTIN